MDTEREQDMVYNSCLAPCSNLSYNNCDQRWCFSRSKRAGGEGGVLVDDFRALKHTNNLTFCTEWKLRLAYIALQLLSEAMHD